MRSNTLGATTASRPPDHVPASRGSCSSTRPLVVGEVPAWGVKLVHALRARGDAVRVAIGSNAADAETRASDAVAAGARGLVVVGGDGVAHIGVNVAARAGVPLGIVPAGSGNDLARALGVDGFTVGRRSRRITEAEAAGGRTVTLGQLDNGRFFGCVLSTGFDAAVNARANRMGGPGGRARYPVAMLAELGAFRPVDVPGHRRRRGPPAPGDVGSGGERAFLRRRNADLSGGQPDR